jgi:uncharacterized protein (TIGR00730 family)
MKSDDLRVTVFGGSKPVPGEESYGNGLMLGNLLGRAGYTVLTGGYIGLMEAVSRGCAEGGGYVIGVTCDEIETWRPVKPNRWVKEEMRYSTLRDRLYALIENCDAAIALPGGIGTLTEIAVMWAQIQIRAIQPCPLILIGEGWATTFQTFYNSMDEYIAEDDRKWVYNTPNVATAVQRLQTYFSTN